MAGQISSIMVRSLELALSHHCCNIVTFEVAAYMCTFVCLKSHDNFRHSLFTSQEEKIA